MWVLGIEVEPRSSGRTSSDFKPLTHLPNPSRLPRVAPEKSKHAQGLRVLKWSADEVIYRGRRSSNEKKITPLEKIWKRKQNSPSNMPLGILRGSLGCWRENGRDGDAESWLALLFGWLNDLDQVTHLTIP